MKNSLIVFLLSLTFSLSAAAPLPADDLPEVPREFRAVWIATVSNIDWPSKPGLPVEQQQSELLDILNTSARLNLNAVVLQVRPMFDALYESDLEPWSEYLTGEMGQAPEPHYDPLAFAVEEAHKRGLELHAWFNPYRARHSGAKSPIADSHVSKTHPDIVRQYGKFLWADPAEEKTKELTLEVILDVTRRYDIDGVHIDDYFYPYKSYADGADFPDEGPWKRYQESGGELSRSDWRRHHVNDFVERFYKDVKKTDPLVKVGISPFGIWRPGHPEGIEGLDQYESLYADAKLWLNEGWVDYFTPQLYWPMEREKQSYVRLLAWWVEQNHEDRHVWPGNSINRVREPSGPYSPQEILNQIEATRQQKGASGNVFFSARALMTNPQGLNDKLLDGPYASRALPPASPWLSDEKPGRPVLSVAVDSISGERFVSWSGGESGTPRYWVLYQKENDTWRYDILPGPDRMSRFLRLPANSAVTDIAVSAVNKAGNEGPPARARL